MAVKHGPWTKKKSLNCGAAGNCLRITWTAIRINYSIPDHIKHRLLIASTNNEFFFIKKLEHKYFKGKEHCRRHLTKWLKAIKKGQWRQRGTNDIIMRL